MRALAAAILCSSLSCGGGEEMLPPPADGAVTPDLGPAQTGPALALTVRGGDDLRPLPSRVIIKAVPPTRRPEFGSDGAAGSVLGPGLIGGPDGVLLVSGQARLPIAPGTYDLWMLQGPAYETVERRVTVPADSAAEVDVVLERALSASTAGFLAADMHIHSRISYDSKIDPEHRAVTEVAAGVELLVPTEHSYHYDLQPALKALGYEGRAVSVPGSEYGFNGGHLGVYPVVVDPMGDLLGAPDWQKWPWTNIHPETYFPLIHALPGSPVVIINHPRLPPDLGYFYNLRWQPGQPLRAVDLFDGIELLGGYEAAPEEVTALLRDWFTLLNEGRRVTALGNSDTHRVDWLRAGYPRTYLRLPSDDVRRVLPGDLREAIRAMRAVASLGPFVNLQVEGKGLGETAAAGRGTVRVQLVADAPRWIDLRRVLLYQDGALVQTVPVAPAGGHPALRAELDVKVDSDGWLVAVAVGDKPLPTEVIGAVREGRARPIAVTNPVWLDRDGDGKVTPPSRPPPSPTPLGVAPAAPEERSRLPLETPLDCEPLPVPF